MLTFKEAINAAVQPFKRTLVEITKKTNGFYEYTDNSLAKVGLGLSPNNAGEYLADLHPAGGLETGHYYFTEATINQPEPGTGVATVQNGLIYAGKTWQVITIKYYFISGKGTKRGVQYSSVYDPINSVWTGWDQVITDQSGWGLTRMLIDSSTDCNSTEIPNSLVFKDGDISKNTPNNADGVLEQIGHSGSANYAAQRYVNWNGDTYKRGLVNGVWQPWKFIESRRFGTENGLLYNEVTDCDLIPGVGTFHVSSTALHKPAGSTDGTLTAAFVKTGAPYLTELYIDWNGNTWTRGFDGSVWKAWQRLDGRVSQRSTRNTDGNWSISGLTPDIPLYIIGTANVDNALVRMLNISGLRSAIGETTRGWWIHASDTDSGGHSGTNVAVFIPGSSTISMDVLFSGNMVLSAIQ